MADWPRQRSNYHGGTCEEFWQRTNGSRVVPGAVVLMNKSVAGCSSCHRSHAHGTCISAALQQEVVRMLTKSPRRQGAAPERHQSGMQSDEPDMDVRPSTASWVIDFQYLAAIRQGGGGLASHPHVQLALVVGRGCINGRGWSVFSFFIFGVDILSWKGGEVATET